MKPITIIFLFLLTCPTMGQYPANIVIGQIQASDPEGGDLRFKIVSGNTNGYFSIDSDGALKVKRAAYSEFTSYKSYDLIIEVSDQGGLTTKVTITVTLRKTKEGKIIKPNPEHILA